MLLAADPSQEQLLSRLLLSLLSALAEILVWTFPAVLLVSPLAVVRSLDMLPRKEHALCSVKTLPEPPTHVFLVKDLTLLPDPFAARLMSEEVALSLVQEELRVHPATLLPVLLDLALQPGAQVMSVGVVPHLSSPALLELSLEELLDRESLLTLQGSLLLLCQLLRLLVPPLSLLGRVLPLLRVGGTRRTTTTRLSGWTRIERLGLFKLGYRERHMQNF
jgi:hypothetical protein